MTIGSVEQSRNQGGVNEDFLKLIELRDMLQAVGNQPLELSMGMSEDFEDAV